MNITPITMVFVGDISIVNGIINQLITGGHHLVCVIFLAPVAPKFSVQLDWASNLHDRFASMSSCLKMAKEWKALGVIALLSLYEKKCCIPRPS